MENKRKIKQTILDELKLGGSKSERVAFAVGRSIGTIEHWARYRDWLFVTPAYIPVILNAFDLSNESELFEPVEDILT